MNHVTAVETVKAIKYEYMPAGIGASVHLCKSIFIPEYQLNLNEDGYVVKMDRQYCTQAGETAIVQTMEKLDGREYRDESGRSILSGEDQRLMINQARDEANNNSSTPIQISKDLVDRINDLYMRSVDDNTPQGQARTLKQDVIQLVSNSGLFQ